MLSMGIVLIGYRGSGKTTVGRLLGKKLGKPFVDADEEIVRAAGKTIAEIFAERGEGAFREMESEVVRRILRWPEYVIALGGGALGRQENRRALADGAHRVVYLRCRPEELLKRIHGDRQTAATRPPLTRLGGGVEEIQQVLAQREAIWMAVKTYDLDVSDLSPDGAVEELMKVL